jgi:hypothetical protein
VQGAAAGANTIGASVADLVGGILDPADQLNLFNRRKKVEKKVGFFGL